MNRAIFLDRDGTINYDSSEYLKSLSEYHLFPFTIEAFKILDELDFKLIVITNQSAINRGLTSRDDVEEIHNYIKEELQRADVELDAVYYCPHHPDEHCRCRKPEIGNITRAAEDFNIDLSKSYFIGDSPKDIEAGTRAGCRTVQVNTGIRSVELNQMFNSDIPADFVVENLLSAAKLICDIER